MAKSRPRRPPRSDWPPKFSAEYVARLDMRMDRFERMLMPEKWISNWGPSERFLDANVAAEWDARVQAAMASPQGPEGLANERLLEWSARKGRPPWRPLYPTRDTPEGQAELRTRDDKGQLLDWAKPPPE